MSETEDEKPFAIERAKTGRAKCKKCKCPIDRDVIRVAKLMSNPFGDGKMKAWHHISCIFEIFSKQRATTKRIDDPKDDINGWEKLDDEGKDLLNKKLEEFNNSVPFKNVKKKISPIKKEIKIKNKNNDDDESSMKLLKKEDKAATITTNSLKSDENKSSTSLNLVDKKFSKDNTFREFRRLCASVANENAYTNKTSIIRQMFIKGSEGDGFKGDVNLWCKMLLPGITKRIYNLQSKQLIKLFSRMFNKDEDEMLEHLDQGDVADTIQVFFQKSSLLQPSPHSDLTIQEVDEFLDKLSCLTKEDEQTQHFKSIVTRCTPNDLKMIIRQVKRDLRITAGAKHVLDAIHDDAYTAFQASRNLEAVVSRFVSYNQASQKSKKIEEDSKFDKRKTSTGNNVGLHLMTPVLPMLAEACKSVDMAMKKCPYGMLSEIKYDGERVQVHKKGDEFRYFSRSLKSVLPHKVQNLKDFIPKAFPGGDDLILDTEILMIDTNTGKPLPFGTLGIHKKAEFKDANVCLFVFDCLYYNGKSLLDKPMRERRQILKDKMTVITNHVMLSEVKEVQDPKDLAQMIAKVIKLGLEGLVLKDVTSRYEPGKRHWLKVKKDYLLGGAMADTADLVVLGAWYGTGKKGGMMSVFLMGCYDEDRDRWLTVTKVHTGLDDATLQRLQGELDMEKIGKDVNLLPDWLHANKPMVPDFVAKDPKKQPVWEITGAEFTNFGVHTAKGISIRFPRVTRIREDKNWATATSLKELSSLFAKNSDSVDVSLLLGDSPTTSSSSPSNQQLRIKKFDLETENSSENNEEEFDMKESKNKKKNQSSDSEDDEKPNDESLTKRKLPINGEEFLLSSEQQRSNKRNKNNNDLKKVAYDIKKEKSNSEDTDDDDDDDENLPNTSNSADYISPLRRGIKRKIYDDNSEEIKDAIKSESSIPSTSFTDEGETKSREKKFYLDYSVPIKKEPTNDTTASTSENNINKEIFKGLRVLLYKDIEKKRRKVLGEMLETLGAKLLDERNKNLATHVVYSRTEVPSTILQELNDIPPKARHVTEAWIETSFINFQTSDVKQFAVTLYGVYCSCLHRI